VAPPGLRAAAAAPPPAYAMPYGFMADLLISTARGGRYDQPYSWQTPPWTAALGSALDADGVPQLGWQQLDRPPASAIGLAGGPGSAAVYVDFGGRTGMLGAVFETFSFGQGTQWNLRHTWQQGFPLDSAPGMAPTRDPLLSMFRPAADRWRPSVAVAAGNLTGSQTVDVVFAVSEPINALVVGLDLDDTGRFRGGVEQIPLGSVTGPIRLAAAGRRVFLLAGRRLRVFDMYVYRSSWGDLVVNAVPSETDLTSYLPDDYRGGAVAAADFGGDVGADLLLAYVAGPGAELRAGYRIAARAKEGPPRDWSWGADRPAPISVAGTEIGVLIGAMGAASARRRREVTAVFRDAAAATQERQQRIVAVARPPAEAPEVPVTPSAEAVRAAVDPAVTVGGPALARLGTPRAIAARPGTDPLQPLAVSPSFPIATYELFRDAFQDRLFPGATGLGDDRAAALTVNQAVVEAFLIGLNHEFGRELLWRGFPLRYGSFFQSFWRAGRPDIDPIGDWPAGSPLGGHDPDGPARGVLFVVRAELLRRIPDAIVYAVPAKDAGGGKRTPDLADRLDPRFAGRLDPDLAFYGFDELTAAEAAGWYFVFQEHPTAPRFGLDVAGAGGVPASWDDLNWAQATTAGEDDEPAFAEAGPGAPLDGTVLPDHPQAPLSHRWGFSSAHMAHILLQRPVQIAVFGDRLLDVGENA
jgi:hypothetical protein